MDIVTHAMTGAIIAAPSMPRAGWKERSSMYKASYRWWNWKPPAGFRFSMTDAAAIVVCFLTTWGLWPVLGEMAAVFPIVLGHFFLFCNVFRVPRRPELLWSGVFVLNVGGWLAAGLFNWTHVLATQLPVTLAVILKAILTKDYHGIGYAMLPWGRRFDSASVADRAKSESAEYAQSPKEH